MPSALDQLVAAAKKALGMEEQERGSTAHYNERMPVMAADYHDQQPEHHSQTAYYPVSDKDPRFRSSAPFGERSEEDLDREYQEALQQHTSNRADEWYAQQEAQKQAQIQYHQAQLAKLSGK